MSIKLARYKDGSTYSGHKQYLGTGVQRSCGKCGNFCPMSAFRKVAPWGMVCEACRKPKEA